MKYLRVINWSEYQHYKNRRAPWIKAYTDIIDPLEHPTFTNLSDGAKLTLHHLRLLAGVTANQIPEVALTRDRLNIKTTPRVTELVEAGFVEWFEPEPASELGEPMLANSEISASESLCARPRAHSQPLSLSPSLSSGENERQKPPRASARELVESFEVTEKHRAWAAEKAPGIDVDTTTEAWRDHFRSNGYKTRSGPICDADAAWRYWMRNEVKFRRTNGTPARNERRGNDGTPAPRPDTSRTYSAKYGTRRASDTLARLQASGELPALPSKTDT